LRIWTNIDHTESHQMVGERLLKRRDSRLWHRNDGVARSKYWCHRHERRRHRVHGQNHALRHCVVGADRRHFKVSARMSRLPVYVCDLDGTLLHSDGTLSELARRGLNQLLADGARLTVASSRSTPAMRSLLEGVDLRLPVIELNGAFISELKTGHHVASNVLSDPVARTVVEAILSTGTDPVLSAWDGSNDRVYFGSRTNTGTRWYVDEKRQYGDPRLAPCDDLLDVLEGAQLAAVTTFTLDAEATALTERLRELVAGAAVVHSAQNGYCSGWTEVQVQHRDAEKGAAVPSLLAACGIADADIIACGDHLNDLGLIAAATHSVAPANAHPAVLQAASEIVGSNDEDGVVRWLLDHHAASRARAC
jgi:Cof subfamily protein (haloacid dehalogenase superfamily)